VDPDQLDIQKNPDKTSKGVEMEEGDAERGVMYTSIDMPT
jgi:hypothetical protein